MKENLISTDDFCLHHNIEFSFVRNLQEFGLLQTVRIKECDYIGEDQLEKLERMLRLHKDLDINLEGIDAIDHLLLKISRLQEEVQVLRNRLKLYEDSDD